LPLQGYDAVRRYLWDREISNDGVYREAVRPIRLGDGRVVEALVYLADRLHPQFAGKLPLARAARLVRQGHGVAGSSRAYVENTVTHLRQLGLRDRGLEELAQRVAG
jgi:cation transport protein ChaC